MKRQQRDKGADATQMPMPYSTAFDADRLRRSTIMMSNPPTVRTTMGASTAQEMLTPATLVIVAPAGSCDVAQ